jgi:hypothetical protein
MPNRRNAIGIRKFAALDRIYIQSHLSGQLPRGLQPIWILSESLSLDLNKLAVKTVHLARPLKKRPECSICG